LVPWLVLYTDDRSPAVSAGYFFLAAWINWIVSYLPVSRASAWFAAPFMASFYMITWWPFVFVLRRVHHRLRLPRTVACPILWVAFEWVRTRFNVAHFELYRLGYSQARFPALIQIADLFGVYGVSFLVASVNGFLADAYFTVRNNGRSLRALADRG